ncbi:MAG: signal peptidase I [Pseudomonadota bacterium]|nr:signal peptidase I [Pseudomonadota bacterium]
MHADFSLLLVVLTLITGVLWGLDKFRWEPRRQREAEASDQPPEEPSTLVDFGRSLFPVVLVVLLVRSFVVEPFRIPSASMVPTLLTGDFILVNKFRYGIRLPVSNIEILEWREPERGDVMVFRFPEDPSKDFIKRVVGLPGDEIAYREKQVFINGEPVPMTRLGLYTGTGAPRIARAWRYREDLPGNAHEVLLTSGRPSLESVQRVPEGHYFVMGDNRDNSDDSRRWGMVPEANLVGKAVVIWMNWDHNKGLPGWSRIGQIID